ncbi:MAG: hypothetical protein D6731_19370 [Planctomycetota bacterium]|nr:MAG: hypothetical protein D6731_19370 [Planctomycetota bacterium]
MRWLPPAELAVDVRANGGPLPRRWRCGRGGGRAIASVETSVDGVRWAPASLEGGSLVLPPDTRQLRYRYSLEEARRRFGPRLETGAGGDGVWALNGAAYLLRPLGLAADAPVRTRFGPSALVPWTLDGEGYARVRARDLIDPGFHGFGVRSRQIPLGGGVVETVLLPGARRVDDDAVARWLAQAGQELISLCDRLPAARVVVFVQPVPGVAEASPFGMVLRSRPPSVGIYLGGEADEAALARDWVAVHEFLHLALPRLRPDPDWLSEGLATYYQEVARLRSGRIDARTLAEHFAWGVRQGRRESDGRSLEECSRSMHRLRCYRAVYWGGALFSFDLDLALRERTHGARGLEDALAALRNRNFEATPGAFARAVDSLAGEALFASVAARHVEGPAFASSEPLLALLGVRKGSGEAGEASERALATLRPGS